MPENILKIEPLATEEPAAPQQPAVTLGAIEPLTSQELNTGKPGWFSNQWDDFQNWRFDRREEGKDRRREQATDLWHTDPEQQTARFQAINERLSQDSNWKSIWGDAEPGDVQGQIPEQEFQFATMSTVRDEAQKRAQEKGTAEAEEVMEAHVSTDPNKPTELPPTKEDSWGNVMWDTLTRVPALFKRQYGGAQMFLNAPRDLGYIMDSAATEGVTPEESFALEVESFLAGKSPDAYYQELLEKAQNDEGFTEGEAAFKEATSYLEHFAPATGESKTKHYAAAIVEGTIHMLPSLVVAATTRSPTAGAALMGGQVFADQYAESVGQGRSHSEATMDGIIFGAAEVLTERVPLGILTKEGGKLLSRTLKSAGAEGIQEPITQMIQTGYELAVIDDEMSMGEAMVEMFRNPELRQQLIDSGIIGAGVGGSLSMMTHPFYGGITEDDIPSPTRPSARTERLPSEYQGDISPKEAHELGLNKVEVTRDMIERVGRGDALTTDEEYTLTSEGYGRFIGEAGEERVVLVNKGRVLREELLGQEQAQAEEEARVEQIAMEGDTYVTTVEPMTVEIVEVGEDVSPGETFVADTVEPRRSTKARLRRAARRAETEPSAAQIEAGNYRKGHVRIQSLPITIENAKGSTRSGVDKGGVEWRTKLSDNYGYIKGVKGKDKDHLDVFVGEYPESQSITVINQKKDPNKPLSESNFDEHKVMVGYRTPDEAVAAYKRNYDDGGALMGEAIPMNTTSFRDWMANEDTTKLAQDPMLTVYRGESAASEKDGPFFTEDAEFATQFTERGLRDDVIERQIRPGEILDATDVYAGDPTAVDQAIAQAKKLGKSAVRLSEGKNQPPSIFVLDRAVLSPRPVLKTEPRFDEIERTNEGKGMTVEAVQDVIRPFYRAFRTAPVVRVVQSVEDLPMYVQQQLRDVDAAADTTGVYTQDPLTDSVYLVANNTDSAEQAIETMIHEIIGHYGLHQVVPTDVFNEVMDKVAKSFSKEVNEISRIQNLNMADEFERRIAAEEYIAYTAQKMIRGESVSEKIRAWMRDLVQSIKNRIRAAFGKDILFTDGQVWSMIAQAQDYVQSPGGFKRDKQRGLRRHMGNPTYYSQMFKAINDASAKNMAPKQWRQWIDTEVKKGRLKEEEVKWSGIREFLEGPLTLRDVSSMTTGIEFLPANLQALSEEMNQASVVAEEAAVAWRNRDISVQQTVENSRLEKAVDAADAAVEVLRKRWSAELEAPVNKVPKEMLMRHVQLEGVDIEIVPSGSASDSAEFDSSTSPDETEETQSDDYFYDEYSDWKYGDGNYEAYLDEAKEEVYDEEKYDPNLDDEENEAKGWDGTSQEMMDEDAQERADESFDNDHYQERKEEWDKKNTRRTWFLGRYTVTTDDDGDFVVYNNESGSDLGYGSSDHEVNNMIASDAEESGAGRWGEYTLEGGEDYTEWLFRWQNPDQDLFEISSHWGNASNMVAHVRFDTREDVNGDDVIFIDEIQSDWHQHIRDHGVKNAEAAETHKQEAENLWSYYMNELQSELRSEMVEWELTGDEAAKLKISNEINSTEVFDWLRSFKSQTTRRESHIAENRKNIADGLYRDAVKAHREKEKLANEDLWFDREAEQAKAEAAAAELPDDTLVREELQNQTWEGFIDAFVKNEIGADQAGGARNMSSQTRLPMLYQSIAAAVHDRDIAKDLDRPDRKLPDETRTRITGARRWILDFNEQRDKWQQSSKGVEPAPFEKTWQLLVIKGMIREAVQRGQKRIFMAPGEVHGMRWGGGTSVDAVGWRAKPIQVTTYKNLVDGKTAKHLSAPETGEITMAEGQVFISSEIVDGVSVRAITGESEGESQLVLMNKIHSVVGSDVAASIKASIKDGGINGTVKAGDVGRESIAMAREGTDTLSGAREIYNVITPNLVNNKLLKKYGASMKMGRVYDSEPSADEGVKTGIDEPDVSKLEGADVKELGQVEIDKFVSQSSRDQRWWGVFMPDGTLLQDNLYSEQPQAYRQLKLLREREGKGWFEAWEIEITPKLEAASKKGFALFSRKKGGKRRSGDPKVDKALDWANKNIGPQAPPSIDRLQRRATEVVRVENKLMKIEQALVDQFAGIKYALQEHHGRELSAEESGYKQAHFTTSGDSQMYAFMMHGAPEWRGGITQIRGGTKGLLEVLEPVASNIDEWGYWMAARRAKRLMEEGREHLFTEEVIEGLLKMGESFPEFQEVADAYADWKSMFLDWAEEAGIFNAETRPLWDQADYVPFYRIKSDELGNQFSQRAGNGVAGIANQINPIRRLKGGKEPLGNILENILINFTNMASTAMKNRATAATIENLEGSGLITPVPGSAFMEKKRISEADLQKKLQAAGIDPAAMPPDALNAMREMWTIGAPQGANVITVLVNGKKKYYNVNEETLLRSLTAINETKFNSLLGRMGMWAPRKAKRLLTTMITLEPGFMVANWFRDVSMAFTNSRHAKFPNPVTGITGALKAARQSKEMVSMMAAGGAFYSGYINAMDPGATAKSLKRAMRRSGIRHRVLDAPWKLFGLYNDLGAASENANRIGSAYIPAIKAGASTAEAVWESKDLMNFAKHGDHAAMQFLIQTVPFLNARIQGLVRYGQRFKEAPGITFTKSFFYSMAVLALWLSNKDDERYKELPEEEKDLYVHFWINGHHWRLPKAFEVGMLFGTVPERMMEWAYSNEDDAGKLAIDRMKFVLDEVFMVMDPVTIVPMPQLIKPMVEASSNYSFFFQGPIVPEYMQDIARVKPDQVYRPSTSPTARFLAERAPRFLPHTLRNPMQLEFLMRGYLGTLGSYTMMMTDDMARSAFDYPPRPELRWQQVPVAGRFYRHKEPPNRTKYEQIMYEVRNEARAIDRAITQMEDRELDEEVEKFLQEPSQYNRHFTNEDVLDGGAAMDSAYREIRDIRKEVNEIWEDRDMTPVEKTMELNELYRERAEAAKDAYEGRPGTDPAASVSQLPIGSLALLRALEGMSRSEASDFMKQYAMPATADLLDSMPDTAGTRLSGVLGRTQ